MSTPSELSQSPRCEKSVWLREERPLEMPPGFEDVTVKTDDIPERTPSNVWRSANAIRRFGSSISRSSRLLMTLAVVNFLPLVSGSESGYEHLNRYPIFATSYCGYAMPLELTDEFDGTPIPGDYFFNRPGFVRYGFVPEEFELVYDESSDGKGPLIPIDRFLVVKENGETQNGFCVRTKISQFLQSYTDETICPGGWLEERFLRGACSMEQGADPCLPGRNVSAWIATPGFEDCPPNHLEERKKIMDKKIADGEFDLMEATAYDFYDILMLANNEKSWSYEYARNMGNSQEFAEKLSLASLNYWIKRTEEDFNLAIELWEWVKRFYGDSVALLYVALALLGVFFLMVAVDSGIYLYGYLKARSKRTENQVPEGVPLDEFSLGYEMPDTNDMN